MNFTHKIPGDITREALQVNARQHNWGTPNIHKTNGSTRYWAIEYDITNPNIHLTIDKQLTTHSTPGNNLCIRSQPYRLTNHKDTKQIENVLSQHDHMQAQMKPTDIRWEKLTSSPTTLTENGLPTKSTLTQLQAMNITLNVVITLTTTTTNMNMTDLLNYITVFEALEAKQTPTPHAP